MLHHFYYLRVFKPESKKIGGFNQLKNHHLFKANQFFYNVEPLEQSQISLLDNLQMNYG